MLTVLLTLASVVGIARAAEAASLSITIDKSVYVRHDGGAGCPGGASVEVAADDDVTFCFIVTNSGSEPLGGAAVGDPALGITSDDMTLLRGDPAAIEPGGSVVWFYETSLGADLVNTATVGAFPLDPSGGPSYGDNPVTSSDTATVTIGRPSEPLEPGITIDKTVYEGTDGGQSCPGAESVTVVAGADLTFCFQVTNTGETHLADVTIDDPVLGITQDQLRIASGSLELMAPGDVVYLYYETTAGESGYVNTASTTGTPADSEGTEIPSVEPPVDEDDASVVVEGGSEVPTASIQIEKMVYAGHDDGASCPGAESIEVAPSTDVTYCFEVENTGEAHLSDVTIDDPTLGITDTDMTLLSGDPGLLAPDATVVWYYETTIGTDDVTNVASTTGTPSRPAGTPIPGVEPPTDEDDAVVEVIGVLDEELEPAIDLEKTVYEGHDGGAGCAGAGDEVFADYGTLITYCFEVTNTGTAYLANVTVTDPTLGITSADMALLSGDPAVLAPGQTVVWYYETTLDDDVTNVATTTGEPVDETGNPIPAAPPSDTDDATVGQESVLQEQLPSTGADADVVAWIGLALLGGGAVLLGADRRRREAAGSESDG
jgi:LPXTG-motif cell wall-anchored protein